MVELTLPFSFARMAVCVFFKILQDTGVQIAGLTFVWIALERLMATVLIHNYEQKTNTVGKIIVAAAVGNCAQEQRTIMPYFGAACQRLYPQIDSRKVLKSETLFCRINWNQKSCPDKKHHPERHTEEYDRESASSQKCANAKLFKKDVMIKLHRWSKAVLAARKFSNTYIFLDSTFLLC